MDIEIQSGQLLRGIQKLIDQARAKAAVYVNTETSLLYWSIGNFINLELVKKDRATYGAKIVATLSQQLEQIYGKGYSYSALTRMMKVAKLFDKKNIATLSQQLSWSHLIELSAIDDDVKRAFYIQMSVLNHWGIRKLRDEIDGMLYERTAIAGKPEETVKLAIQQMDKKSTLNPDLVFKSSYVLDFLSLNGSFSEAELEQAIINNLQEFILELGSGFAFLERQKRISIDATDYYLDLLFYHRKLKRLVAIDLKIGKFRPEYKAQMELYLQWLKRYEMQVGEDSPIGLLLCSEGNTEHVELLMLDNKNIRVAQYLTELPSKKWFVEKLHRAVLIAKNNYSDDNEENI